MPPDSHGNLIVFFDIVLAATEGSRMVREGVRFNQLIVEVGLP